MREFPAFFCRVGFLLLGGPGETEETVRKSFDFVKSLDLDGVKVTTGIRIYPDTPLARRAVREGIVDPGDSLLHPRFYLSPLLGNTLKPMAEKEVEKHPNWFM